jgi:hypothetical protein
MITKVSFDINGNPLDEYNTFSYVFYRNFKLKASKKSGYMRNSGQEIPETATSASFNSNTRYCSTICNGLQTPKKT